MQHAGPEALDRLEPLLGRVRREVPGLVERGRGRFYRGATAFLRFHADPAGLFADLKVDGDWVRFALARKGEASRLVRAAVASARPGRR